MSRQKIFILSVVVYCSMMLVTFGQAFNRANSDDSVPAAVQGIFFAIGWPLYWSVKLQGDDDE